MMVNAFPHGKSNDSGGDIHHGTAPAVARAAWSYNWAAMEWATAACVDSGGDVEKIYGGRRIVIWVCAKIG